MTIAADKILVTVGRKPATEGWGLEAIDLDMDGPFIRHRRPVPHLDARRLRDRRRDRRADAGAPGDRRRARWWPRSSPAKRRAWDKVCIPAVCFTDPEIVTAGLSPEAAKAAGIEIMTGAFPFRANGRAMTLADRSRLHPRRRAGRQSSAARHSGRRRRDCGIVGGVQPALEMGARLEDVAGTIHAHPTQSEGMLEAALKTLGHPIHI